MKKETQFQQNKSSKRGNKYWEMPIQNFIMPERKVWTEEQDKILKFLREQRGEKKWAHIARIMQQEFHICGRNGKQCRERYATFYVRYHNHLESSIVNGDWTNEQNEMLFNLHEQVGNKWSVIAQSLQGRSDNCVKNHFYSKLRKAIRRLNKIILQVFTEYTTIRTNVLSKIIEITDSKFKNNSRIDQDLAMFSNSIKNRLFRFQIAQGQIPQGEELQEARILLNDIESFDRDYKKGYRCPRSKEQETEYKTYLKPPSNSINRQISNNSNSSSNQQDGFSYLSSSSIISSCSDLSEYDQICQQKPPSKTTGPRSVSGSSGNNSGILEISRKSDTGSSQIHYNRVQKQDAVMQPQQFGQQYEQMIEVESEKQDGQYQDNQFSNMFYDNTPVMARILAPSIWLQDEHQDQLFKREVEEDIQFKGQF